MTVAFQLEGQEFTALNGGPQFKFTEAISLVVNSLALGQLGRRSEAAITRASW
jgi:predicted 3-demethylubiquinone-9 3-methyltransferase (glyoxalase superfamily)